MNILIFGGAGYLGIPFSDLLIKRGHNVIVYDYFKYSSRDNLNPSIQIINDDIANVNNYKDIFNEIDVVFYFNSPRLHEINNDKQIKTELNILKNVCEHINERTVFFFNSSCSVYGKTDTIMDEKSETQTTTKYSKLKVLSENYLLSINKFKVVILRLATLFGSNILEREDLLINKILYYYYNNKQISIFDKSTKRPYLHVLECATILHDMMNSHVDDKIINVGYNRFNYTKEELINLIENTINNKIDVQYFDTEDSRSYFVNFNLVKKYIYHEAQPIEYGIYDLYMREKIKFSLEDWDSILDYHRPNGSSKTWYLNETGYVDIPKMWGQWNIVNVEDNNKMFGIDTVIEQVTPSFYPEYVEFRTKDKLINEKHIYLINIYDPNFFNRNIDVGFKCISEQYIKDIKEGRCYIVMMLIMEGYSGSDNNYDLEIIDKWINEIEIPHSSVFYLSGNLIIDKVLKQKGLKFNAIPLSTFETWVNYHLIEKLKPIKFVPKDDKFLYLSYNRNPRRHRKELISLFLEANILDKGKVSMNTFDISDDIIFHHSDHRIVKLHSITPLKLDKDLSINWANDLTYDDYINTFISVVTETLTDNNTLFFSEKIFKPLALGHPFMVLGNKGTLSKLKEFGYKTFSNWIDESYDEKETMEERALLITEQMKVLNTKNIDELKKMREEMYDICLHNQNNFRKVVKEKFSFNGQNMNGLKEVLSIINKIYRDLNKTKI